MSQLSYELQVEIPANRMLEFGAACVALKRYSETRDLIRSDWEKQFPSYKSFVGYLIDTFGRRADTVKITGDETKRLFTIAADQMSMAVIVCAEEMVGESFVSVKLIKAPTPTPVG